jgi:hypothetical protein
MIDQAAAEAIEDVLDDFSHNREMFTVLDISKGVQARLKAAGKFVFEDHRHLAMKDYIHDQCNAELDGTWNIKIENVDVRPFLYYPVEKDPASYVTKFPVQAKGAAPGAPFPAQQFQVVGPATAAVKVPGTCVFNSADYLHVPRRIVRNMGLNPGDTMHVVKDGDGVARVKALDAGQDCLKDVNIDNRQYLRVTRAFLSAAGLSGAAFTVTEDAGRITIKVQTDAQGNPIPAPVATN